MWPVGSFLTKGYNIFVKALYKPSERRWKKYLRYTWCIAHWARGSTGDFSWHRIHRFNGKSRSHEQKISVMRNVITTRIAP